MRVPCHLPRKCIDLIYVLVQFQLIRNLGRCEGEGYEWWCAVRVCYTNRCVYSRGVSRTHQRALERGFGGVGSRFSLYLEFVLEV